MKRILFLTQKEFAISFKLFESYATGNYSLLKLTEEAAKVGFLTKKGKKIAKSQIDYYSCTNAKGICKKVYIRKEPLVESLSQYFDHIALSEEQIAEVTSYLKKIHESESLFHTESLTALRKEQDRIQKRINQMYDDKLDGVIDERMYFDEVKVKTIRPARLKSQNI